MEVTVEQEKLLAALELLSRVSAKHVTLPVLQCVHIEAKGDSVTLQATNMEVGLEIKLPCTVSEPGIIAVPTQIFLQSVNQLQEKNLVLRVEDKVLQIETSATSTSIKLFEVEEFPTIKYSKGETATINTKLLALGIKSVVFSASQTSIKPELGSVYIKQKKEHSLTFVATDSFRLMEKTVPQKNVALEQNLMIPHKNASELARVCETIDGEAKLVVNENQCAVQFSDGTYFTTRLVTGSFPDYEQIIPKEYVTHVTLLKEDLIQSLKKTNIFLNKFRQVSLAVTDKNLTTTSQNNDVGHTTNTIKATSTGEELNLSFNQQYLMDPLSHIQDDSLKLSFAGLGRAMVITGVSDKTFRYLVMPMNK
jgi:DNA polymerase-3 subunit beta